MANNSSILISVSEMNKWGHRLEASEWAPIVWKSIFIDSGLLLLWLLSLFFMLFFMLQRNYVKAKNGSWFTLLIISWLIGDLLHGAIFGPTGSFIGYHLQTYFGESTYLEIGIWTNKYLTLFGFLTS